MIREGLFDAEKSVFTLDDLFKKYKDLDKPEISGVEFYQFVKKPDADWDDLKVITTMDNGLIPGDYTWSGFDDGEYNEGDYLLSFPRYARSMVFSSVEEIDRHLQQNHGQFKLPGVNYN